MKQGIAEGATPMDQQAAPITMGLIQPLILVGYIPNDIPISP